MKEDVKTTARFECTCWSGECAMHTKAPTLDEIEARLKGVEHPGPWEVKEMKLAQSDLGKEKEVAAPVARQVVTAWVHGQMKDNFPIALHWCGPYQEPKCYVDFDPGNATFIANAPRDMAYLLRIARAAVKAQDTANVFCAGGHPSGCECLADLRRAILGFQRVELSP